MNNCSNLVSEEEKCQILSEYMNTLRVSGYDERYRYQILKGVLERQKQMQDEVAQGNRAKYRSQAQIEDHKRAKLGNFANTWFLNDEITGIMKIPCTPGSKLLSTVRQKSEGSKGPDGGSTKFVEMGGTPVALNFKQTEYLVGQPGCQYSVKCFISEEQDCRISRGVYRIKCKTCEVRDGEVYVYIGTRALM